VSQRWKWLLLGVISAVALGATALVGITSWVGYQQRQDAPSSARIASSTSWAEGDRVVFRNTASGQGYGLVASVPLSDPGGPRALTKVPCDRVSATRGMFVCLRAEPGIAPTYDGSVYDDSGVQRVSWALPGIPSRARFSPDGTLVATTAFVTGQSYATVGFSTEAVVRRASDGASYGNLEDYALSIDGRTVRPVDRNVWGVTFADDRTFYATVGTGGKTYLVRGDLRARTLRSIAEGVECPSLSPDRTRIAFKRVTAGTGATVHWTPAVLTLATGAVRVLTAETRSVDDQIEWLDDATLLYGLPNQTPGDSDVWRLAADGSGAPSIFIHHAWSPSIVRSAP
jgi:hypothetical protein